MAENSEEEAMRAKARMCGLEYVPPRLIDTRRELADLMPESVARECNVLAQPSSGTVLNVLMSDPLDFETIDRVRFCCGRRGRSIEMALASHRAIQESIDRVYGTSDF
jgi:type IV pilus assembly protein PilB